MILVRWSKSERSLPGAEVDEEFTARPDDIHLFAFTTDRMHVGEHSGKLSVKMVTHGREEYRLGRRTVSLGPGQMLLVNEGQSYASSIDQPGTRSISFFLPAAVGRETWRGGGRFDEPSGDGGPDVLQVPFRPGPMLDDSAKRLAEAVGRPGRPDPAGLEELVLRTATEAMAESIGLASPDVLSDRVRRSTREELVTRVLRARDLIYDTHGRATLSQMSFEARLSRYYFLRTFEAVFGVTPARFARRVRLQRGRESLQAGDPTRVAARKAGYKSVTAFLRALRNDRR